MSLMCGDSWDTVASFLLPCEIGVLMCVCRDTRSQLGRVSRKVLARQLRLYCDRFCPVPWTLLDERFAVRQGLHFAANVHPSEWMRPVAFQILMFPPLAIDMASHNRFVVTGYCYLIANSRWKAPVTPLVMLDVSVFTPDSIPPQLFYTGAFIKKYA